MSLTLISAGSFEVKMEAPLGRETLRLAAPSRGNEHVGGRLCKGIGNSGEVQAIVLDWGKSSEPGQFGIREDWI